MTDLEGVEFLQWCLPRLGLRWPAYRKVRRTVYKRIARRLKDLGLSSVGAYRAYLGTHPGEWGVLDTLCWIPISRFCRDKGVFGFLGGEVLPQLAESTMAAGDVRLRCWSIGCASGEEPYTLGILWDLHVGPRFPELRLQIVATDVDPEAIERAQRAWYTRGSLKDLPMEATRRAFAEKNGGYLLKDEFRTHVRFLVQDVRSMAPDGPFRLVLCRNAAFTYFDDQLQRRTLRVIRDRMMAGGVLVLGSVESLPEGEPGFEAWSRRLRVFRRSQG